MWSFWGVTSTQGGINKLNKLVRKAKLCNLEVVADLGCLEGSCKAILTNLSMMI